MIKFCDTFDIDREITKQFAILSPQLEMFIVRLNWSDASILEKVNSLSRTNQNQSKRNRKYSNSLRR